MDAVFGVEYDGGVILAADQSNARSILVYQTNVDKIVPLTDHSAMGCAGPNADVVNFTQYISKNLKLYELSHDGSRLSTHAQANFARGELATALRRGPYQVNALIGGYDSDSKGGKGGGSLYFLDYLASLQRVKYGAQGYAAHFTLGLLDREWREGLTEAEAVEIVDHCIQEMHTRFLVSQPNFIVKAIDKDGVRVVKMGADPADT
mmetsp:Transcript_19195/g.38917  ORF Transcript_19195/g.38917 Transcript_19195/m.38917 type:complete len:206 (-) Transcript_19195:208-825(-)